MSEIWIIAYVIGDCAPNVGVFQSEESARVIMDCYRRMRANGVLIRATLCRVVGLFEEMVEVVQ